jgi:hypothetical protein
MVIVLDQQMFQMQPAGTVVLKAGNPSVDFENPLLFSPQ